MLKIILLSFCFKQLILRANYTGAEDLESVRLLSPGNMSVVISNDGAATEQSDGNLKEAGS